MVEVWRDIRGFEGQYQVSNYGEVKSLCRRVKFGNRWRVIIEKICRQRMWGSYKQVFLGNKSARVHRLVAEAFVPNLENKPEVNHKNGVKTDNRAENLEWVTHQENAIHAFNILGIQSSNKGKFGVYNKKSKVVQQLKDNQIVAEYYGCAEASRMTGIRVTSIRGCCNKPNKHHMAGGFQWRWK